MRVGPRYKRPLEVDVFTLELRSHVMQVAKIQLPQGQEGLQEDDGSSEEPEPPNSMRRLGASA